MKSKQTGFTLVEIAIVLVIIGLLLGGVLKGQELVNSAKVKGLANEFKSTQAMLYGYQDRFRVLPGDDPAGAAHVGSALVPTAATAGNGVINGTWNSVTTTDESFIFWNHVRLAGLATGNALSATLPTNSVGGTLGISSTAAVTGQAGSFFICSSGINGRLAQQLDNSMDDGMPQTGSMWATAAVAYPGAAPAAGTPYAVATSYTVCLGF